MKDCEKCELKLQNCELKKRIEELEKIFCDASELCNQQALRIEELEKQLVQ